MALRNMPFRLSTAPVSWWLVLILPFGMAATAEQITAVVTAVRDGDTIEVRWQDDVRVVHIYGIDCPELNDSFGLLAKEYTSVLLLNKKTVINIVGENQNAEWVGDIIRVTGNTVSALLVRAGLARCARHVPENSPLVELETFARQAQKGIWKNPSPRSPQAEESEPRAEPEPKPEPKPKPKPEPEPEPKPKPEPEPVPKPESERRLPRFGPPIRGGSSRTFKLTNEGISFPIAPYECASLAQSVETISPGTQRITVTVPPELPRPSQRYPIESMPAGLQQYLAPTRYIQSDAPAIVETGREILEAEAYSVQVEVVAAVLRWMEREIEYGTASRLLDASACLDARRGDCIGFVHLSAALLRALGIPARTVRTFVARSDGAVNRYYLLEVYYPEDEQWILYESRRYALPSAGNIYLYSDPDWNHEKHQASKTFSQDSRTRVVEIN